MNRFLVLMVLCICTSTVLAVDDSWMVRSATKFLELSESLDSGFNRESIATINSQSFIDDGELPQTLASGVVFNGKGDAPYEQRLYFEDTRTGYVVYTEDSEDVTADFLYFADGKQIARYELEFTTALESDVDDSSGSASTTGTYLTDMEYVTINMLGKDYTVTHARRNKTQSTLRLILMDKLVRDSMLLGSTKTYSIDGQDYEVTLDFVDSDSAKFTINGETTKDMLDGDMQKLSGGATIGVSKILFQDFAGGVHSAEFFLGIEKIELRDLNIGDSKSSNELIVDDDTIGGANVWIEGSDDNSIFKIDKIVVNMSADDDYYVPAGGKLSENPDLSEPEILFTDTWDIAYYGLTSEPTQDITIAPVGNDDYRLEFVDGRGNKASVPLAYTSGVTNLKMGDTDDDLRLREINTSGLISKDDYFIVTDENKDNGERKSSAMRYRGSDALTDDNPVIKFDELGSGDRIERTLSAGELTTFRNVTGAGQIPSNGALTLSEVAQIKISGGTFRVYNASSTAADDFNIFVDLNGDGTLQDQRVSLNTQYGAEIQIIGNATSRVGTINVTIRTPNIEHYDTLKPTAINVTLSAASGEVDLAEHGSSNLAFQSPQDDDDNAYAYTSYGAFVKLHFPANDPGELTVTYPQNQRVPQVFVIGSIPAQQPPPQLPVDPTCDDNIKNGNETGADCGAECLLDIAETCNNIDDNRNCLTDEGLLEVKNCGLGVCSGGFEARSCTSGIWSSWSACSTQNNALLETCNGLDDDCDGILDGNESLQRQCGISDTGACTFGSETCNNNGQFIGCTAVFPSGEVCEDGIDQDCSGDDSICLKGYDIFSPLNIDYNARRIPINILINHSVDFLQFKDEENTRSRPTKLCSQCNEYGNERPKTLNLNDGSHALNFFSSDGFVNDTIYLFIDSTAPKIISQELRDRGYCTGEFSIQYSEDFLKSISLNFGDEIITKQDCPSGKNQVCIIDADLGKYEGLTVGYNFAINDTFNKIFSKRNASCVVDTIPPLFQNEQFRQNGNKLFFNFTMNERVDTLFYIDLDDPRQKENRLCSRCDGFGDDRAQSKIFSRGIHQVRVFARDDAGNSIGSEIYPFVV